MKTTSSSISLLWLLSVPTILASVVGNLNCRYIEGDAGWPSTRQWNALNATVGGRLHKVIPPGAPCYNSFENLQTYDAQRCAEVTEGWRSQEFMYGSQLNYRLGPS